MRVPRVIVITGGSSGIGHATALGDFTAESRSGSVYTRLFGTRPGAGFSLVAAAAGLMLLASFRRRR